MPRPLSAEEANGVFAMLAARGDQLAFRYLREGCECRAQLMIERPGGARSIEISEVPLSQAQILEMHRVRALVGQDLDAVVFSLARAIGPIPERGGSGFRLDVDPPEGVSVFARERMQEYLRLQHESEQRQG